jgi:hypothetical protein
LERLGLEYMHERFGIRNRFFIYLKERTMVFNHQLNVKNHIQGIKNLKLFLNQPIHAILSGCKDRG